MPFKRLRQLTGIPDKEPIDYAALNNPDLIKNQQRQQFGQIFQNNIENKLNNQQPNKFEVLNNESLREDETPESRMNSDKFIKQQMETLDQINNPQDRTATFGEMLTDPDLNEYELLQLRKQALQRFQ